MKPLRSAVLLALALAACQQNDETNIAIDEGNSLNAEIETLPPDESTGTDFNADDDSGANAANPVPPDGAVTIPAQFHGRWGMVPADCTSTRGDAKGLIAVDATGIKFYESRATLAKVAMNAPENFTGDFKFTGEGQTWTKPQNLKLTGSSNTLIRSETEPAMTFTYKRCTA